MDHQLRSGADPHSLPPAWRRYASTNDRMLIPGPRNPSQNVCTGPPGESRRNESAGEIAKVGLEP
jgi:hypothetical protein